MYFIDCEHDLHAPAILAILNDAILNTTALYDYKPRTAENMQTWFTQKLQGGFPVIGAVDSTGLLLGFASYGTFRNWPAYKYSVEHSVYVHPDRRGQGVGYALMRQLIARAELDQKHLLVGGIDAANQVSIHLHEKLGFSHAGTIRQAGYKFGKWLDLAFYQLILQTPAFPCDD